jgi:hypothetical protein
MHIFIFFSWFASYGWVKIVGLGCPTEDEDPFLEITLTKCRGESWIIKKIKNNASCPYCWREETCAHCFFGLCICEGGMVPWFEPEQITEEKWPPPVDKRKAASNLKVWCSIRSVVWEKMKPIYCKECFINVGNQGIYDFKGGKWWIQVEGPSARIGKSEKIEFCQIKRVSSNLWSPSPTNWYVDSG